MEHILTKPTFTHILFPVFFISLTRIIMPTKTITRLTIDVSPDFRDELKIQAIAQGKTLKKYVLDALMERIQKDSVEEDRIWAKMSATAKNEGSLSAEASDSLLSRMKNA